MLSRQVPSSVRSKLRSQVTKATLSTQVQGSKIKGGAIGRDGRHEVWREGIYDQDNNPK